jgi:hypothetical protein
MPMGVEEMKFGSDGPLSSSHLKLIMLHYGDGAVVNEGEGEVRAKKFPTLECYESGEVRDGMKKR